MSVVQFRPSPSLYAPSARFRFWGVSTFPPKLLQNCKGDEMKVFISWSGKHSQQIALALRDWLPSVIQALDPWVSTADIEKGESWFTSINESLVGSNGMGIFCLTAENLQAPWMAFEAGALAVHDRARVATFLHGVGPDAIKPPLGLFQATNSADKTDVFKLLESLNVRLNQPLSEVRLKKAFDSNWDAFERDLSQIQDTSSKRTAQPDQQVLLHEILAAVRRIEKDAFKRPGDSGGWPDYDANNPLSPRGPVDPNRTGGAAYSLPKNEYSAESLAAALRAFDGDPALIDQMAMSAALREMNARLEKVSNELRKPASASKIFIQKKSSSGDKKS